MTDTASIPRVLVTGVGGGSVGEQVYKALRLSRRPCFVIAANIDAALARVVGADAFAQLHRATAPEYVSGLCRAVRDHGADFVIPGSEPDLKRLVAESEALRAAGAILLANSPDVVATCLDKACSQQALAAAGFRVPRSVLVSQEHDLSSVSFDGPWIVKPNAGSGGSTSTYVAQDAAELQFFARHLLAQAIAAVVQEYVGTATEEYTVGVLHSPAGDCLGSITIRRDILSGLSNRLRVPNRTGRRDLGDHLVVSSGITQGTIVRHDGVEEASRAIAAALGSTGPLNVQGRLVDGVFVPFEINPRFSGTAPMRALAGFNEPERLIEWHREGGRVGPEPPRRYGRVVRGLVETLIEEPGSGEIRVARTGGL